VSAVVDEVTKTPPCRTAGFFFPRFEPVLSLGQRAAESGSTTRVLNAHVQEGALPPVTLIEIACSPDPVSPDRSATDRPAEDTEIPGGNGTCRHLGRRSSPTPHRCTLGRDPRRSGFHSYVVHVTAGGKGGIGGGITNVLSTVVPSGLAGPTSIGPKTA